MMVNRIRSAKAVMGHRARSERASHYSVTHESNSPRDLAAKNGKSRSVYSFGFSRLDMIRSV